MSEAVATDSLSTMPAAVRWLAPRAFVIALPLFLILGNVLDVAGDREFYLREFAKYDVGRVTGLDQAQLATVADAFIAYLRDPSARLDVEVTIGGVRRPLFNEKEVHHMDDVQKLFKLVPRHAAGGRGDPADPAAGRALAGRERRSCRASACCWRSAAS